MVVASKPIGSATARPARAKAIFIFSEKCKNARKVRKKPNFDAFYYTSTQQILTLSRLTTYTKSGSESSQTDCETLFRSKIRLK